MPHASLRSVADDLTENVTTLVPILIPAQDDGQAERRIAQARARAERAALRAAARAIPPECGDTYAHLTLSEMRAHRHDVSEAEERIGYWQRVAAQRLEAMRGTGSDLDVRRMNVALATKGLEQTRATLMRSTRQPLPAVPELAPLWAPVDQKGAPAKLEKAVNELATYHAALAATAKAATAELIARYRQTPSDCLAILPA